MEKNLGAFAKPTYVTDHRSHCAFCKRWVLNIKTYVVHGKGSVVTIGNKTSLLGDIKFMEYSVACQKCYDINKQLLEELLVPKRFIINDDIKCADQIKCGSYVLVSMGAILCLLKFILSVDTTQLIMEPEFSYIGSVICITFQLADNTTHVWYSSMKTKKITKKFSQAAFDLNVRIPMVATLAGGRPRTIKRFLQLLQIPLGADSSWRYHVQNRLHPVVSKAWEVECAHVMDEMNTQPSVNLQEDEQHSRPQRNGSLGHAPFVTVTVIWGQRKLICALKHVNRILTFSSSAAACLLGRQQAFCYISQNLAARVAGIVTDACTGAGTSVRQYLKVTWPNICHSHDLWHKTRKWVIGLASFCCQKPFPHARTFSKISSSITITSFPLCFAFQSSAAKFFRQE